ncbi:MAG: bifunctional 4-hydroxy-2-oxoglutarate aldolase/2-dehydro-3-deoxy-phosphogluconate aldolase [Anaerolineales bacterium]|nr:bifunctional 4-hydroxy-2-oxoglutarate aldolase/2-dehydro-3-deoxy-phosphogluconate aldolase [Desulfobacteraceae bacterium]MCK4962597.1 bifunctional 4-hydroxy-2-oxoglutarate aldolase/2-dehydro-3-deoxy-phosphogluconate aldolase [Anaerolineales bacterium]
MEREKQNEMIREAGVIAIIRARTSEILIEAAEAINTGGLNIIEVTMTTPDALNVIKKASEHFGDQVLFGAGTVLDPETARAAILAEARFIVSPNLNMKTIEVCRRYSITVVPGCLTPTEILTSWEMGADFVKVFPADVGGPAYIKAVLAPMPQIALIPTGGVTVETIGPFLKAGAAAVATGSSLVSQKILDEKNFSLLTERAKRMREEVIKARQE